MFSMDINQFLKKNYKKFVLIFIIPQLFLYIGIHFYEVNQIKCFLKSDLKKYRNSNIFDDMHSLIDAYTNKINNEILDYEIAMEGKTLHIKSANNNECLEIFSRINDYAVELDKKVYDLILSSNKIQQSLDAHLLFTEFGKTNLIKFSKPEILDDYYKNFKLILPFSVLVLSFIIFIFYSFFFDTIKIKLSKAKK